VVLTVSDTGLHGCRHAPASLNRFPTKETGGGGLGLSTVYGIVKQSGTSRSSETARGTTFGCTCASLPPQRSARPHGMLAANGPVEDQEPVRRLTRKIRNKVLLAAADGPEALRMSQNHPGTIHILVTDVVMPGMNGREVGRRLTAERPGIRVLYLSGHADSSIVSDGVLEPGLAFLQKPFTPEVLARRVRELLDAPPQPGTGDSGGAQTEAEAHPHRGRRSRHPTCLRVC
jgi:CheY-like chemotaxis protein